MWVYILRQLRNSIIYNRCKIYPLVLSLFERRGLKFIVISKRKITAQFLDNKLQQQLKNKYGQQIRKLTKEIQLHKRAKYFNYEVKLPGPDNLLTSKVEINKFQRELLIRLHKDGDFSDAAIRQIEREIDIDELRLNEQLPKEE